MRIVIDNLQKQDSFAEVNSSIGKKISGGNSIQSSFRVIASSDNAKSQASGNLLGFGDKVLGSLEVSVRTDKRFSASGSLARIISNRY